ncbi:hypothetical protein ABZP36_004669 [Zizania latifolia]
MAGGINRNHGRGSERNRRKAETFGEKPGGGLDSAADKHGMGTAAEWDSERHGRAAIISLPPLALPHSKRGTEERRCHHEMRGSGAPTGVARPRELAG